MSRWSKTLMRMCVTCEMYPVMVIESCNVEGAVRLSEGQNNREGRVEYCSGGVWGTVCGYSWDANDAGVVCNQLGYPSVGMSSTQSYFCLVYYCRGVVHTGATPLYYAYFGQGAGPVTINTIVCSGSEPNISNCTISTPSSCSHYNDAGVRCAGQSLNIIVCITCI